MTGTTETSGAVAAGRTARPVPGWVRFTTVAAVVVVAGVAAVVSYLHMRRLAELAGEEWRAALLPLSVDGLLVAASLVLLVRRLGGRGAGVLPWAGLVLGLAASLGANVAAAQPTTLGRLVAAWPTVGFALAFELLIVMLRDSHPDDPPGDAMAGQTSAARMAGDERDGRVSAPGDPGGVSGEAGGAPGDAGESLGEAGEPAGEDRVTALIAEGVGRRRLAAELGISEHTARRMLSGRNGRAGHRVVGR